VKGKGKGKQADYKWKGVESLSSPPAMQYALTPGPCLPQDLDFEEPLDFFTVFFSSEVFKLMVEETNIYAQLLRDSRPLKPRSRLRNWKDVIMEEMKAFVGLILNIGIIRLPTLQDYSSMDMTTHIPFFSQVTISLLQWCASSNTVSPCR
jgi:hypothetical protein